MKPGCLLRCPGRKKKKRARADRTFCSNATSSRYRAADAIVNFTWWWWRRRKLAQVNKRLSRQSRRGTALPWQSRWNIAKLPPRAHEQTARCAIKTSRSPVSTKKSFNVYASHTRARCVLDTLVISPKKETNSNRAFAKISVLLEKIFLCAQWPPSSDVTQWRAPVKCWYTCKARIYRFSLLTDCVIICFCFVFLLPRALFSVGLSSSPIAVLNR